MNGTLSPSQWLYKYKGHHILMWLAYFGFFFLMYRRFYPSTLGLLVVISVYFIFNAMAFYTTAYLLFPRFLYKGRYFTFGGWFFILITILSVGLSLVLYYLFQTYSADVEMSVPAIFQVAFLSIFTMVGLMAGVKLLSEKVKEDRNGRAVEKQRLESELQYLKAQVNPHFLFNAINSVYFLIKKNPDAAAETLIKLSDLLRFQLYDCSGEIIPIEKEMEYLDNYVALEKIRKGDKVKVYVSKLGILSGYSIAPFMLIPFLENAFKHVSNSSQTENRIEISFKGNEKVFELNIVNTTEQYSKTEIGGIGLKNVKRRLELLYPLKHDLQIVDEPGSFRVTLILQLS